MKRLVIVSGYFNPVHIGHIRLLKAAKELGDILVVIVNNDLQQNLKKGKIIMQEEERLEIVKAIRFVDDAFIAIDDDPTVSKSIVEVASKYEGCKLIFANGGDRQTHKVVPESTICHDLGIEMRFDVGGVDKPNSSTNINQLRGVE